MTHNNNTSFQIETPLLEQEDSLINTTSEQNLLAETIKISPTDLEHAPVQQVIRPISLPGLSNLILKSMPVLWDGSKMKGISSEELDQLDIHKGWSDGSHLYDRKESALGGYITDSKLKPLAMFSRKVRAHEVKKITPGISKHVELLALFRVLEMAHAMDIKRLMIHCDCQGLMKKILQLQFNARPPMRHKRVQPQSGMDRQLLYLLSQFDQFALRWIPREENIYADTLSKNPSNLGYIGQNMGPLRVKHISCFNYALLHQTSYTQAEQLYIPPAENTPSLSTSSKKKKKKGKNRPSNISPKAKTILPSKTAPVLNFPFGSFLDTSPPLEGSAIPVTKRESLGPQNQLKADPQLSHSSRAKTHFAAQKAKGQPILKPTLWALCTDFIPSSGWVSVATGVILDDLTLEKTPATKQTHSPINQYESTNSTTNSAFKATLYPTSEWHWGQVESALMSPNGAIESLALSFQGLIQDHSKLNPSEPSSSPLNAPVQHTILLTDEIYDWLQETHQLNPLKEALKPILSSYCQVNSDQIQLHIEPFDTLTSPLTDELWEMKHVFCRLKDKEHVHFRGASMVESNSTPLNLIPEDSLQTTPQRPIASLVDDFSSKLKLHRGAVKNSMNSNLEPQKAITPNELPPPSDSVKKSQF